MGPEGEAEKGLECRAPSLKLVLRTKQRVWEWRCEPGTGQVQGRPGVLVVSR